MRVRLAALAAFLIFSFGVIALPVHGSVIPSQFGSTSLPLGGAPIGFAYLGDGFVGSIQRDGTNVLYSTNLTGGNIQPFAASTSLISSPSGEHFVAGSLGLGGFPSNDVYVAAGNTVVHIAHNGASSSTFISGLTGNVRGILFDTVGTFNHDMLVTTDAGRVYEITSAGVATLIANTGEDTEGLDVAPLGGNFGVFNGSLLVASEGSGNIRAISPTTHSVTIVANVPSAEMLSFVPLNLGASGSPLEGLYGANYSLDVVFADASQFAGLQGDVVVTGESTHVISDVHFNGTAFVVSSIGFFPNQPEDGIFVTTTIINSSPVPEPASWLLMACGIAALGSGLRRKRI